MRIPIEAKREGDPGMIIRKASSLKDLKAVWKLTYDAYYAEGYTEAHAHGLLAHYPHLDVLPETTIFLAEDGSGSLLGTISYTDDGPGGLQVDGDFQDIVNQLRASCKSDELRLGCSWRVVTQQNARGGLRVFMKLLGKLTTHLEENEIDVLLCTFNPRHISFYKKIWDMKVLARRQAHAVKNAPGVLMRGDLTQMVSQWKLLAARRKNRIQSGIQNALA